MKYLVVGLLLLAVACTSQSDSGASGIGISELSLHNNIQDCWISYGGEVYDVTEFLPKHPGSAQAILPYCGTAAEFEEAFSDQHGSSQIARLKQEGRFVGSLVTS